MKRTEKRKVVFRSNRQRGSSLIELMIAMLVLAIGLGALTTLIIACMVTDNRNSKDTSATLLAQKVIEELSAQNTNAPNAVILTDCAGNNWAIPSTQGAAGPAGQGAALATSPSSLYYGGIDFTQSVGAVPAGFSMQYVDCSLNGRQTTYDVRWNVMTVTANSTRLITASARQLGSNSDGLHYSIPVTLRAVGGS
jgi:prepilin-type N-terminal cleavage/methylation domain-containing protein